MNFNINRLERFMPPLDEELLLWFAKLPMSERLEILRFKHSVFHKARKLLPNLNGQELDMLAIFTVCEYFYQAKAEYNSSQAISPEKLKHLNRKRIASAKKLKNSAKLKTWLARNLGKIVELRNNGISYRIISKILKEECNVNISHTTIWAKFKQFNL